MAADLARVRRRRRLVRAGVAIAACLAVLAVAVGLWPAAEVPLAEAVARVETSFGGVVVREPSGGLRSLSAGDRIRQGQRVEVGQRSGLGVIMLDADLRLGADSTVVFAADAVELLDGRLYVDTRGSRLGELRIVTRAGTFEHLGTQYLVSVEAGEVVGAVREGRIVLHGPTGDVTLAASDPAASMVVVSSGGELTTRAVSSTAELWHWVADLSPGFVLVGRNADDAFRWVARERGQRLEYASPAARWAARSARLGGSDDRPLPADEVVAVIAAATELRAVSEQDGAVLSVSLGSKAD
ncbi:MAG: hypothetical protein CMQ43_09275 [Gammaproteobacteria bacterium]|nr:hypothetical protein [Gammaproteobacteria bacterium]MBK81087.1 hypothetical protein [Gammaproteobacteria bacterium]|tara:strand:- start:5810 stop:6703 length:894 start_codon:yes stop_codon:yes gene_type:complete